MCGSKQMLRGAVGMIVILLFGGCGKNRQGQWPAVIAGYQNFSEEQKSAINAAVTKLNLSESVILTTAGDDASGYPIYFELATPDASSESRAGLATVADDKCTIQISPEVFSTQRRGYMEPVIWHELGHCAGLTHTQGNGEIMYYATQPMADYSQDSVSRFLLNIRNSAGL